MGPRLCEIGCKSYVFLPSAGRRTQLFHLIFTQPGTYLLEHPCTLSFTWISVTEHSGFDGVLLCLRQAAKGSHPLRLGILRELVGEDVFVNLKLS